MKYSLSFVLTVLLATVVYAQPGLVAGVIRDAETREPLVSCSISLLNMGIGTISDKKGKFAIQPPNSKDIRLLVSFAGYRTDTLAINNSGDQHVILLRPLPALLNEVVLTGVTRATLIRENPVAITGVSSKNIDIAVEANIVDALVKNVPGLNAVKTGPNISKPFIRGLGYNRVLTLYDGIRQEGQQWGDEHGIEVDAYNIDKAEVIKGPSSLMFGSDALAGVVSMFPYMPKEKDGKLHGRVLSEYQSNNGLIGNGFRVGYNNGHWLWALRGSYRIAKNYSDPVDGRVYNTGFRETNISATAGFSSPQGFLHLNATLYNNLQGIPDGSRDSATRKFTKQVYEGSLDDITTRPIVQDRALNSYLLSPLHQQIQHYRLYTNGHYKIGRSEAEATVGFQQNIRKEYNHPSAAAQPGLYVRLNTLNYGFRYSLPAYAGIELTAGLNGMYQNNKSKNATDFPVPDYTLLDAGAYLYGKWKSGHFTLSGGLRYDLRKLQGNDFYVGTNAATGFSTHVFTPDTAGATLQFASFNKSFRGSSLGIGAALQLTPQLSVKANIARGYRSPNITEFASNGLDPGAHIIYLGNRAFVPEFSLQEDVGVSANFTNVSFNMSLFNNNIQNYIYLSLVADAQGNAVTDAQGNKTFQYEQAAARLYGAEVSLAIHPSTVKGLSINNSLSLTYGLNKKNEYLNKGVQGEYLPLIPPLKWLADVSQEIKIGSSLFTSINLRADMEYNAPQKRYLSLFNTETATSSYMVFNMSVGSPVKYFKNNLLQIQLQANNLFNVAYQSHLSRLKYFEYYASSPGGHTGMYNPGRSWCAKIILSF